jgi:hypothetical protein
LFGRRTDVWAFGGSALVALVLAAMAALAGVRGLGDFGWLALVLAIDVAHVHATWFRTYLDREELARHPLRYWGVPVALYLLGVWAYQASSLVFWRVLAYAAVFHFVRQQVGWVALYRARSGAVSPWERRIDEAAIYAATLFPLFYFHVHRDALQFSWFVPGDFYHLDLARWVPVAALAWALALAAFMGREAWRLARERRFAAGKTLVVVTTALTWYVGIVACNSDFVFTATNVIPHGVPYAVLLFSYTRERAARAPSFRMGHVSAGGFGVFALALVGCAFVEQLLWDRLVDHDRPWLFGEGAVLETAWLAWVVPLLALPQATHYALDGLLWRRSEGRARPALRAALGSRGPEGVPALVAATPPAHHGGNA